MLIITPDHRNSISCIWIDPIFHHIIHTAEQKIRVYKIHFLQMLWVEIIGNFGDSFDQIFELFIE